MTLDGGSFSVLEEETFAGEGDFRADPAGREAPGLIRDRSGAERQFEAGERAAAGFAACCVIHGVMTHESELREKKTYTFRNEDSSPRTVIVEHPVRAGYELRSEVQPVETSAGWMRFRVASSPSRRRRSVVEEARPFRTAYLA